MSKKSSDLDPVLRGLPVTVDSRKAREKDDDFYDDDTNFTFRVNSALKEQFMQLCKQERYSAAAALKRYMHRCVEKGHITHDFRSLRDY